MSWKIQPTNNGWWLFREADAGVWWHVYRDKWFAVFPTLDAVFEEIKEKST